MALHRWQPDWEPADVLSKLKPAFDGCDAHIFNLESQLTSRTEPVGKVGFFARADPAAIEVLTYLGVDAVTCANNHCLDYGRQALLESTAALSTRGILVTGVKNDAGAADAILEVNGLRIGLLAYTDDWHTGGPAPGAGAVEPAAHDPIRVRNDIAGLRARVDLVVVQLHWGYEWTMYPVITLRDLARSYIDAGADMVSCHHAHVPRAVETWNGGLIAHGLGNLYFGPGRRANHPFRSRSFLLRVDVCPDGVLGADIVPIHTTADGRAHVSSGADRDVTLRAISYLAERIDNDRYLARVEHHELSRHACTVIRDLAQRLDSGDESGATERMRLLSSPRQRWMLQRVRDIRGLPHEIERALGAMCEAGEQTAAGAERERVAQLGRQAARWLERSRPIGSLP